MLHDVMAQICPNKKQAYAAAFVLVLFDRAERSHTDISSGNDDDEEQATELLL